MTRAARIKEVAARVSDLSMRLWAHGELLAAAGSGEGAAVPALALAELGREISADATEVLKATWDLETR